MPGFTTPDGFIYEVPGDQPGISLHSGLSGTESILAEQVQAKFTAVDADLDARFPPTVQDEETDVAFNFTHTSYAATGGDAIGVAFVAASSGRAIIHFSAGIDVDGSTNAVAYISPFVRAGGTVGSGGSVLPADDFRSVRSSRTTTGPDQGGARFRAGASVLVEGLTAGDTYNVRLEHRVTSATGTLFQRNVIVAPAT